MQNSNVKGHIVESGIFLVGYMVSSLVVLWGIGFGRLHQHGDTIVTYSILFGTLETLKILLTGKILRVVLFFTNVFTGYYLMAFIDIIRRRCSIHDISPLNTGTYELVLLLGIVLSGFSYILLLIKHLHTRNGDLKWRKNIRRTKKRVSEIERERGQVQQMKLEPMAFSAEPASGELQYKELSKQENPIVGEEVEAALAAETTPPAENQETGEEIVINSHESKVITVLDRILKNPNFFEFSVYERKALRKGKRNEILTHSLYVIRNISIPEEMTLSYNGTETAPFSEGAWILNTDMDIDSYYSYSRGNNSYDMRLLVSSEYIDTEQTARKIKESIKSDIAYFFLDHKINLKEHENCNTALFGTLVPKKK